MLVSFHPTLLLPGVQSGIRLVPAFQELIFLEDDKYIYTYYKIINLKQYTFITSQFYKSEVWTGLAQSTIRSLLE